MLHKIGRIITFSAAILHFLLLVDMVASMGISNQAAETIPITRASDTSFTPLDGETLKRLVTDATLEDIEQSHCDLNGILWMEHINLITGPKVLAEHFYIDILGCTRNPGKSFHVNLGQQQFHLAEAKNDDDENPPQKIFGSVGLAVPNLTTLRERVERALSSLKDDDSIWKGTQLGIVSADEDNNILTLRGPWGNLYHIYQVKDDDEAATATASTPQKMTNFHAQGGPYGSHRMAVRGQPGIRFVQVTCPNGKAPAIAQFYREILGCTVTERKAINSEKGEEQPQPACTLVSVGPGVHLVFVESSTESDDDDDGYQRMAHAMKGVHICFYADDFQGLYQRLANRQLIWTNPRFVHLDTCDTWEEARASRTLRFKDVIDLETGEKILELEHETRPLRHGQYLKYQVYDPK